MLLTNNPSDTPHAGQGEMRPPLPQPQPRAPCDYGHQRNSHARVARGCELGSADSEQHLTTEGSPDNTVLILDREQLSSHTSVTLDSILLCPHPGASR